MQVGQPLRRTSNLIMRLNERTAQTQYRRETSGLAGYDAARVGSTVRACRHKRSRS